MKYNLSAKRKDTGKYWGFGSMKKGDPNYKAEWNIGIRNTPEFRALIEAAGEGGYINLNAYPDDRERTEVNDTKKEGEWTGEKESDLPF